MRQERDSVPETEHVDTQWVILKQPPPHHLLSILHNLTDLASEILWINPLWRKPDVFTNNFIDTQLESGW